MDGDFNHLLSEIRKYNLCTWYLLPLVGLNRFSFGEGLFINSYLDRKNLWIIVQIPDLNLVSAKLKVSAIRLWSNDRGGFLAYSLPSMSAYDVHWYIKGMYSRFSNSLKSIIFERSGLPYRKLKSDGGTETDIRLLALEGREVVRDFIERELQVIMDPNQEVLGKPSPESFMDIEEG